MMSINYIRSEARRAARESAARGEEPRLMVAADFNSNESLLRAFKQIPFLGGHTPRGWKKIESLFVDSSGLGADDEPAMSIRQFLVKVRNNGPGIGYSIEEVGQFQVYIRVMRPVSQVKP